MSQIVVVSCRTRSTEVSTKIARVMCKPSAQLLMQLLLCGSSQPIPEI